MYCGNNALNPRVASGQTALGTRYKCLKKGIGKGLNMPYDPSYLGPYAPIDQTRAYCGTNTNLPENYDKFGSLTECLQKGVGIGKRKRSLLGPGSRIFKRYILPIIIWLSLSAGIFSWLYFAKPVIITGNTPQDIKKINWTKFSVFFGLSSIMLGIILVLIWKIILV